MSEYVINIDNVSKKYRLGVISTGSLSRDIQSLWSRFMKKDDPNSKISSKKNVIPSTLDDEYTYALRNINLNIKKGEILGIIGKNGAGKSTILKVLSRITPPTSGSIKINGRVSSLLEVGTGFHPDLTGKENIFLNGAILGMTRLEIFERYDEIVDFSEVAKYIDTPVKRYSSGMRIRLAFSVAAHLNNDILLVDEVLAVGDAQFRDKCIKKMNNLSSSDGKTVIFVSHNLNIIKAICTQCLFLKDGKIEKLGKTDDIINDYLNDLKLNESKSPIVKGDERKYQIKNFSFDNEKLKFQISFDGEIKLNDNHLFIELLSTANNSTIIFKNLGLLKNLKSRINLKVNNNKFTYSQYRLRIRIGNMGKTYYIFEPASIFELGVHQSESIQYIETEIFEEI
ncbi:MAG: hypothetical protein CMG63_04575 [Candidatus Marinimicrobia bacterium]|nr:hypothetical protein [Candidatus Neomarinimicrobiota bacterium]